MGGKCVPLKTDSDALPLSPILAVTTGGNKDSTTTCAFGMDSMFNCGCWSHIGSPDKSTHAVGTLPQEADFVTVPARIPKSRIKRGVLLLSNTLPELCLRSIHEQLHSTLPVVHIWRETGAQDWCFRGLRACPSAPIY